MSRLVNQYTENLHKQFNYFGTWLPNQNLELGDIGVFENEEFIFRGNIKNQGINFEDKEDPSFGDMDYSTNGGVTVKTKLSGQTPEGISNLGKLDAGLIVDFHKKDAILFKAKGTQTFKIKDQIALAKAVEALFNKNDGSWEKEWVIVTEIIKAESTSVLISSEKGAQVELKAKGEISAGTIDIADANAEFGISTSRNMSTQIVASKESTPLFKAMIIKKGWFDRHGKLKSKGEVEKSEMKERLGLGGLSLNDL